MRPLFWSRIQVPPVGQKPQPSQPPNTNPAESSTGSQANEAPKKSLWQDLEEMKLKDDRLDEFCQLFKRTVTTNPLLLNRSINAKSKETVSVLDPKRAHTINILVTSRHLRIKDIKHTVYNLDTSIIDVETLKQIHEVAGTPEELQAIETFLSSEESAELGKAEQFIYELSKIDSFNDRFKCIMFEVSSSEQIQAIESKLNNFRHICEVLTTSERIQQILSIILALGNYMNGGNRDRGQADGFGLEILPKLRDVKSATNSSVTLLHFVVQTYIQAQVPAGILSLNDVEKPLPEPGELEQASTVVFEDLEQDLKSLKNQIETCQQCSKRVEGEHQEPFRSHTDKVLSKITKEHQDQNDNLQDCIEIFKDTSEFYCWKPKSQLPIREFFSCWIPFCRDFNSIFKNELLRKIKQELENVRAKVNADKKARTKDIKTSKASPSGLKAKFAKKGLLNNFLTNSFT